jgi:hypothetical protein
VEYAMSDHACGAVWSDVTGRTRLTVIKALTNPCGILNALQAVSNAQVLYNWDGTIDPAIGTATAAQYQAVQQNCELTFQTSAGTILRLTLPAPPLTILKADKKTVDPALVSALVTACLGQLSDGSGNAAAVYLGGVLQPDRSDLSPIG